jgi:SRSO17 transposase
MRVAGCFPRRETRQSCGQMLSGLLMELDDHNCWAIAEAVGHRGPHRLQHLLSRAVWDDQQVLDIASAWAAGHLDDGDAVLIVDETADEKSSAASAGAARQYSGTVGGVALCQVAVTLTYATGRGHALIGQALYLPEGCAADEEHRELAGIPEEVMFASKPQLASVLLDRAQAAKPSKLADIYPPRRFLSDATGTIPTARCRGDRSTRRKTAALDRCVLRSPGRRKYLC